MLYNAIKNKINGCLCFLALTGITSAGSPAGSAFYEFLEDPINSRSIGMGTAGTALPGNRGFSFYNPALPAINKSPYLSFDYGRQYEDLGRAQAEFAWVSQSWFFDLGFQSQSSGEFSVATEQGILEGATQTEASILGIIGGGFYNNNYGLGITFCGIQNKIADSASYGVLGSAGAVANLFENRLFAGIAVLNFGAHSSFLDNNKLDKNDLPLTFRGGLSWNDTLKVKYPYSVAVDVVYSKNYGKVLVPLGLEFWLFPSLAIRAGKRINFESDLFSLGIGVHFENLAFDAGFTPTKQESDVGLKWSTGITYTLASFKRKSVRSKSGKSTDSSETLTTDTVKAAAPVKSDSVPVFKSAIERKITRKSSIETDMLPVDSVNMNNPDVLDTLPDNFRPSGSTLPDSISIKPAPADTLIKQQGIIPDKTSSQVIDSVKTTVTLPLDTVSKKSDTASVREEKQIETPKAAGVKIESDSDILEK